jgi:hypothetical protein
VLVRKMSGSSHVLRPEDCPPGLRSSTAIIVLQLLCLIFESSLLEKTFVAASQVYRDAASGIFPIMHDITTGLTWRFRIGIVPALDAILSFPRFPCPSWPIVIPDMNAGAYVSGTSQLYLILQPSSRRLLHVTTGYKRRSRKRSRHEGTQEGLGAKIT